MPKVMIWVRKEDYGIWSEIDNKPHWLHNALNINIPSDDKYKLSKPTITKPTSAKKDLLSIPGVEIASEAKCKGTHYMDRTDCGKIGCLWKGL